MINPINLTFDSNIFNKKQYGFDTNKFYISLKKAIDHGYVKLYLSRIVVEETKKHLVEDSLKYQDEVSSAINRLYRSCPSSLSKLIGMPQAIHKIDDIKQILEMFDEFLRSFKVKVIEYDDISLNQIFQDYFNLELPFENNKDKKHEFPDSVIFHQIKSNFSVESPITVLCKDGGLKRALETLPDYCKVCEDPDQFLSELSVKYEGYENVYQEISTNLSFIMEQLKTKSQNLLSNSTVRIRVPDRFDEEKSILCAIDKGKIDFSIASPSAFRIIDFTDDNTTASLFVNFTAEIEAHYDYFRSYKEVIQEHKGGCWIEFVWDRQNNELSSCQMNYTFNFPTMKSQSVTDPEAIGICSECKCVITKYNDGFDGICSDCRHAIESSFLGLPY